MKKILPIVWLLLALDAGATNYYFSSTTGDDTRSASQAQNPATPWKSIAKLNSYFPSMLVGDSALFKAGETFYGSLIIGKSGTSGSRIVIGKYGSGPLPNITGFTTVSGWTSIGTNLWESSAAVSTLSSCNILSINGGNYAKGRTPNTGYWSVPSSNTTTTITDATNLSTSVVSAGAEVVLRELMYEVNKYTISNVSGNTITFAAGRPVTGWGYFIQNDPKACNVQNEWAYNSSTKKLTIYSTSTPANVNVPTIEEAVNLNGKDYITITDINFSGFNTTGINTNGRTGIKVLNCDISFIGVNAIYAYPNSIGLQVSGNTITDCGSRGVHGGSSSNAVFSSNTITRIGHYAGMGSNGDDSYCAIISNGDYSNVLYNTITDAGYIGIRWDGNGTNINGNKVQHTTYIKSDGGAIYCYPVQFGNVQAYQVNRAVRDNIIINASGASAGTPYTDESAGIYTDGQSGNIDISHNTILGPGRYGVFNNGGRTITVDSNTVYGYTYNYYLTKVSGPLDSLTVTNNYFVAAASNSAVSCGNRTMAANYKWNTSSIPTTFAASNNMYANLLDQTNDYIYGVTSTSACYSITSWASLTGKESGIRKAPLTYPSTSYIRVEYNETGSSKTVSLAGNYRDLDSNLYAGSITLAPYSSKVLTYISSINQAPTLSMGSSQSIKLPLDSTTISGTATDPDGTIASYAWTKVSGPSGGSIVSPSSASTKITGLQVGSYQYQLVVTDNNGATATGTINIAVSSSGVIQTSTIQWKTHAFNKQGAAILNWTAVVTPAAKSLEVQRKVHRTFATVRDLIGGLTVLPALNADYKNTYSCSYGTNLFRIKITDTDGKVTYSSEYTVKKN